jgi:hypothetical protein
MKALALAVLALLCGCSLDLSNKLSCTKQADCNDGWACSAGTCMRVNDGLDGDLDPAKSLTLWLKADVGVLNADGMPAAPGEQIKTWQDQSGRGFDAKQIPTNYQPTFWPDGGPGGGPGGGPVVAFDGVDDILSLGDNYIFSDKLGMMFFVVVRSDLQRPEPKSGVNDPYKTDPFLMSFGAGGNNDWALFYDFDTISFRATTTQTDYTPHTVGAGNWTILTYQLVFKKDVRVRVNGEEVVWETAELVPRLTAEEIAESPNRRSDGGPVIIGAQSKTEATDNRYFGGAIAEIRIHDNAMYPDDRDAIECELSLAYGIPLNPHHEDCQ